jgi:hypothetical protein
MNEEELKQYILSYLVQEQNILDYSDFFFDAFPADIESIGIVDNTWYNHLKAYHETTDSEVDFNIDSRGFSRKPRRIRTSARFPFYNEVKNLDLSTFQIFSLEQLRISNELLTDHCLVNCLKYLNLDFDIIEFARGIIRDTLSLKSLNKICSALL